MPYSSFIDLSVFQAKQIQGIFSTADLIKANSTPSAISNSKNKVGALVFFESSTRTRMSFEIASVKEGYYPILFEGGSKTSLEKGETLEDTILNIAAMEPEYIVIRCGDGLNLKELALKINIPIINAGWGVIEHPTQALLDIYTILQQRQNIASEKILIVGDVKHSRVAHSHFKLAKVLGYELAVCAPGAMLDKQREVKVFETLKQGLDWATVVMALRVQHERHKETIPLEEYKNQFALTKKNLQGTKSDLLIMHPGPVNHGVEMDTDIFFDTRSLILKQVTSGVYIRRAIIRNIMGGAL